MGAVFTEADMAALGGSSAARHPRW
jgi:hypothetical protein